MLHFSRNPHIRPRIYPVLGTNSSIWPSRWQDYDCLSTNHSFQGPSAATARLEICIRCAHIQANRAHQAGGGATDRAGSSAPSTAPSNPQPL
ncbi:hypothetical protein IF1G_05648 [Cordyceps javanica]|uniref:Uncharacterized protein n=1 Tax=Cordyceps javanica TaxID=43265 RepID=A0A545V273_9HYPO|nr:hypothetical protein IF1G_05648 [Cordyceps javanica]